MPLRINKVLPHSMRYLDECETTTRGFGAFGTDGPAKTGTRRVKTMRHKEQMRPEQMRPREARPSQPAPVAQRPNLTAHYKPVGIQAVSAATVCRPPAKPVVPRRPDPDADDS